MCNLIQILMVLAIANPFCCCTAGLLSLDAAPEISQHSCCAGTNDAGEPSQSEHDTENCPHQATKEFQLVGNQDAKNALTYIDLAPSLVAILAGYEYVFERNFISKVSDRSASTLVDPPSISQDYCVFRI